MNPLRSKGISLLSFHPYISIIDSHQSTLEDVYISLEGDEDAIRLGEIIAESIGAFSFRIKTDQKPIYHLGASIASNFLVTTIHEVTKLYRQAGLDENTLNSMLLSLLRSTLNNMAHTSPVEALTGPIARGDFETLCAHLELINTIKQIPAEFILTCIKMTIRMARETGYINRESEADMLNEVGKSEKRIL